MSFLFEMVVKTKTREITHRTNDMWQLLHEAATAIGPRAGSAGAAPKYSGARGEIEIGVEGGDQVLLRVLPSQHLADQQKPEAK